MEVEKTMGTATAIRKFFGEGCEPVTARELMEFKKADPTGYYEVGEACLEHFKEKESEEAV